MARSERPSLTVRRATRSGLVACGALLAACQSILGIEDLSPDPDPAKGGADQAGSGTGAIGGKAGSTSSGGTAGAPGGRGGSSGSSGAAGAAARAGASSGGSAGAGVGGSSGAGGSKGGSAGSGGSSAGSGGEAGMPDETGPVTGTIIDFWHHPLANIPVQIGDVTTTTDASGNFVIPDVAATYDVGFIVTWSNPANVWEWVYQGLTRRDPTLQAGKAFNDNEAHFYVTQTNGGTFGSGLWYLAIGSENGSRSRTADSAGFDVTDAEWQGPDVNNWTLHSLFLEKTGDLPTGYVAYETKTAVSDANGDPAYQNFEMDLSMQDLDTGNVSGAIVNATATGEGRKNYAFVRFSSGGALQIVDRVDTTANSYQYLLPSLPNGDITIAAAEEHDDGGYTIAHNDGNNIDESGVNIVIPPPVGGQLPGDGAVDVDAARVFSFNEGDPENSVYVIKIEAEYYQQGIFVVTTNRQITLGDLPIVDNRKLIIPNDWHMWSVQTHGKFDSVDDVTTPSGFLDAFTLNTYLPQGPSRGDGAYTTSPVYYFKTVP